MRPCLARIPVTRYVMRAWWLRAALACLAPLAVVAACGPVESEVAGDTPAPTAAPAVTQPSEQPAPTPEATTAVAPAPTARVTDRAATAAPVATRAAPTATPTSSPSPPAPRAPTETPSPTPTAEPTAAVNLYLPPATAAAAAPTAVAETEPTAQDLMAERLRQLVQEGIRQEFPMAEAQPVHVFPLGLSDAAGDFWGAVTDGPQPFRFTADDEGVSFFHFVAAYQLSEADEWIEVDRLEIETAPQHTRVELPSTGWVTPGGARVAWIAVSGGTGAHAGTLDIIGFDGRTLHTELSWLSARPNGGEIVDLDGDGVAEVVVDNSNPYVFCYVCAVELKREVLYRWDGSQLAPVELRAPSTNVPDDVASQVDHVVALAQADLWREAAVAAIAASRQAPESPDIRWLSILVNRTATARLIHAGTPAQPLLTMVFAGEYGLAVELMRAFEPARAFALDGPLIVDTEAEYDLATMATQLLDYTTRALDAAPDRAEIHAVHALGLTLASPDDLAEARSAMRRAAELAPDDAFYRAVRDFLADAQQAPGTPPGPPAGPEPMLAGPSPAYFAEGYLLGSGDRGRSVKALHQRLACIPVPGFSDPGRYFDVYHEATRRAVVQFQADRGLTPTGVVDATTWNAIEEASAASPYCSAEAPAPSASNYNRLVFNRFVFDRRADDPPADNPPADDPPADDPPVGAQSRPAYGEAGQPVVYLTFDDGPHPDYTLPMLEILSRYDAVGTFFALGVQVQRFPDVAVAVVAAGHQIESHTVNHPSLAQLTRDAFIAEVVGGDEAIRAAVGDRADPLACLRPPYGAVDGRTAPLAAELGKSLVMWDVDPQDWRQPGADQIAAHILSHAYPGAIILMHDGGGGRSQTVAALETVLAELSTRGYSFRSLPVCDPAG